MIGVLVLAVAMLLLMRAKTDADRRVADIMLMSAIMPVTVDEHRHRPGPDHACWPAYRAPT